MSGVSNSQSVQSEIILLRYRVYPLLRREVEKKVADWQTTQMIGLHGYRWLQRPLKIESFLTIPHAVMAGLQVHRWLQ